MRELSQQLGHDLVPTTSNGAHGLAMTVDAVDHDIIVLDAALVKALFTSEMGMVVHSIHHELGHAHDHAVRRRGWAASLCQERFSPLRHRLFPLAERLWSEYHAERWSAGSIRGASLHAPILIEFVPTFLAELKKAISSYRFHANIPLLLDQVAAHMAALLQFSGYVLGDLAGTGSDPSELHPDLPRLIESTPLSNFWPMFLDALDQLFQTHGSWKDSRVFLPLEGVLAKMYAHLGIVFSEYPEGLRVDVPF